MMRIIVTGGDGFIGRNLRVRLTELGHTDVISIDLGTSETALAAALASADFVFHLAGVNRPTDDRDFQAGNVELTARICAALEAADRKAPLVLSSSTQAERDIPYGRSKRDAEIEVGRYGAIAGAPVFVLRLTNVFGKWARPNYNSAVATFSHNLARGLPIAIHDATAMLHLVYIDDVVATMTRLLDAGATPSGRVAVEPSYVTTVGEVAAILQSFVASRPTNTVPPVGVGLARALYATYLSYVLPADFSYTLVRHTDPRGSFVEMIKTTDFGQFSYFTAHPGITRGEHYHHTKTEKFLVITGTARFCFRHILTDERYELVVDGGAPRVVETVPGWVHDITNIGTNEMVVMLWASEIFDPQRPDTIAARVNI
jgi:UDP-2-acetamido-2,6-beta-L-arabino-hexul-4-ose reductase